MIHFIGIGGAGMFALACIAIEKGYKISGSDVVNSENLENLSKKGAKIYIGHSENNITQDIKLVVYSGAVKQDNPEIIKASELKIKILSRSQFLGLITKDFKNLIAVSGSHGKTTTTSMITSILMDSGKDPTAIIGACFDKIGGNSRLGKSDIAVCEACEYLDSFLDLDPKIGVILNIDLEHMDYFKTLENEKKSFLKFAKKSEIVVVNKDDDNSCEISKKLKNKKIVYYGIKNNAEFTAKNIALCEDCRYKFDIFHNNQKISNIKLNIFGEHNVLNVLASFAACYYVGVDFENIVKGIENFKGAKRRFEFLEEINGVKIFDDYAHHPAEIRATLNIVKKMNFNNIWVVFQPHTYSRTYFLFDEFVKCLSMADRVIITDILPVREKNIYNIKSENLAAKIKNAIVIKEFDEIAEFLKKNIKKGDVIMHMGAGNIKCADIIREKLRN